MGLHDIAVNEIAAKNKGVDISVADILAYKPFLDYIDFTDDDQIPNLRAVKSLVGLPILPIEQTIPSGINYTYAYDGRFGANPIAYVQQQIVGGWRGTSATIDIMNSGDIVALGDFTNYSGEVYRLVVRG